MALAKNTFHLILTAHCVGIIMVESHLMQKFSLKVSRLGGNFIIQHTCNVL